MIHPPETVSGVRRSAGLKRGVATIVAALTCPCHLPVALPVLLTLTAGTALGSWLSANTWSVWALFGVLFVASLMIAMHGLAGRTADGGGAR